VTVVAAVADGTAGSAHAMARASPTGPVRRSTLRANEPGFGMRVGSLLDAGVSPAPPTDTSHVSMGFRDADTASTGAGRYNWRRVLSIHGMNVRGAGDLHGLLVPAAPGAGTTKRKRKPRRRCPVGGAVCVSRPAYGPPSCGHPGPGGNSCAPCTPGPSGRGAARAGPCSCSCLVGLSRGSAARSSLSRFYYAR
jgi:hypothetical protein